MAHRTPEQIVSALLSGVPLDQRRTPESLVRSVLGTLTSTVPQYIKGTISSQFVAQHLKDIKPFTSLPFWLSAVLRRVLKTVYGQESTLIQATHWTETLADRIRQSLAQGMSVEAAMSSELDALSKELVDPNSKWRQLIILTGISFAGEPFELLPGTTVYPAISLRDGSPLLNGQALPDEPLLEIYSTMSNGWIALVSEENIPKIVGVATSLKVGLSPEAKQRLLTALRITKNCYATIAGEILINLADFPSLPPMVFPGDPGKFVILQLPPLVIPTTFTKDDFTRSKVFYATLDKSGFEEPVERFNRSFDVGSGAERITDLTIALEALFDLDREHSYRLSTRCALLLASPAADSDVVYRLVRAMYDVRSAVSHGNPRAINKRLSKLSGMASKTLSSTVEVGGPLPSAVVILEDYERWLRGTTRARNLVRVAILACLSLAENAGHSRRWPFPDNSDLDAELLSLSSREKWRRNAGVDETNDYRRSDV